MPLLDYKCPECKKEFSELVKNCEQEVLCPDYKVKAERIYYGKPAGTFGKKPSGCTGHCSTCGGCH